MTKLIAYLVTIKHKIELVLVEAKLFCLSFRALYLYLQDVIMRKKIPITNRTLLEETALFFESMMALSSNIIVKKLGITRRGKVPKRFLQPNDFVCFKCGKKVISRRNTALPKNKSRARTRGRARIVQSRD